MTFWIALIGAVLAGTAAWFIAEFREREKNRGRLQSAESRARLAEVRAEKYHEQNEKLERHCESLRKELTEEKQDRVRWTAETQLRSRATIFRFGVLFAFTGFLGGALLSGVGVGTFLNANHEKERIEREVDRRFAKVSEIHFQKEIARRNRAIARLRRQLDEARITRAVAATKLEMILESLVENRFGRGYTLDLDKFRDLSAREDTAGQEAEDPSLPAVRMMNLKI